MILSVETVHIVAALASALLHAGWNAAIKASAHPTQTMTAQMVVAAVVMLPVLIFTGMPHPSSWAWALASTLVNVVTVQALLRAYALGGFGLVYPMGRAVSVMAVVPLSAWWAGEVLGPGALWGVGLIVLSLLLVAVRSWRGVPGQEALPGQAVVLTVLAGLGVATYVMTDAQGVRASGSPLAYAALSAISNAVAMGARQWRMGPPWGYIAHTWRVSLPAGVASSISYLLILWVWAHAPIALGAALRDTSAVFAVVIAVLWLKEPMDRWRALAVAAAVVAVPLMRWG